MVGEVLSAPCRTKCQTVVVLTGSQPVTSPSIILSKALLTPTHCRYQLTDPKGWIALLARAHVNVRSLELSHD